MQDHAYYIKLYLYGRFIAQSREEEESGSAQHGHNILMVVISSTLAEVKIYLKKKQNTKFTGVQSLTLLQVKLLTPFV